MYLSLSIVLLTSLLLSCSLTTTRPKLELTLAAEAFQAAKEAKAEQYASREFRMAELSFLKAKSAYQKKFFDKAKEYAQLSMKYAELAELQAIKNRILGPADGENSEPAAEPTAESSLQKE